MGDFSNLVMLRLDRALGGPSNGYLSMSASRLRFYERSPGHQHLSDADRYLLKRPMASKRVVIIGTGTVGQEHMYVAHLLGKMVVHGIYDTEPDSMDAAERRYRSFSEQTLVRYKGLEEACNDPEADALIICTPNHTHFEVVNIAMESGKPILLEKPLATTLSDAAAIVEASETYSSFIQVGLQYRYKAQYVEALHEVKMRLSLGDIKTISMSEYRPPFLDKVKQWNKFNEKSGGTLVEKCCHYFDLMNIISESTPVRVYASGGQSVNFLDFKHKGLAADIDDHAFVIVDYKNGLRANFSLNMFCHDFTEEMVIVGDKGSLRSIERVSADNDNSPEAIVAIELGDPIGSRRIEASYPSEIRNSGHQGATFFEHVAFFDQLTGKQVQSATPLQGLWAMIVAAAAQNSILTRQVVDISSFMSDNNLSKYLE